MHSEKDFLVSMLKQIDTPDEYDKGIKSIVKGLTIGGYLAVLSVVMLFWAFEMHLSSIICGFMFGVIYSMKFSVEAVHKNTLQTRHYLQRQSIAERLDELNV